MNPKDNIEKLIKEKGVQFRDFRVKCRSAEDGEEKDEMVIEGKAAAVDSETVIYECSDGFEVREVVEKDAFKDADMSDVIFNYNHSGRVYARTRNKTLGLDIKEDGLYMTANLRKDDEGHVQLFNDIKSGCIDRMSFAFTVADESWEETDDYSIRRIKAIDKVYDVSAVDIPAYDATEISARSAFEAESERRKAESLKALKLAKAKYAYFNN